MKETSFKMTMSETNDTSAIVKINDVQFQAFKSEKNTDFGLGMYNIIFYNINY